LFVFRVHEKRVHADVLEHTPRALDRIHQQHLTQSLPLHGAVHGEPAKPDSRDLVGQFLREILGQLGGQDLACGQRVKREYSRRDVVRDRDKHLRDAAPLMLLRGVAQPGVKLRASALERASVVATS
jgi:hypothetical protein